MAVPVEQLPKNCHWARAPKVGLFHVPGCMGGAVYGPEGCTCKLPLSDKERNWRAAYRRAALELERALDRIGWLEQELKTLGARHIPLVGEVEKLKLIKK
jgi:hypothetical protein